MFLNNKMNKLSSAVECVFTDKTVKVKYNCVVFIYVSYLFFLVKSRDISKVYNFN